jgi:hypothetical protein
MKKGKKSCPTVPLKASPHDISILAYSFEIYQIWEFLKTDSAVSVQRWPPFFKHEQASLALVYTYM